MYWTSLSPFFLVPVLSKFTAEDFWGTEPTIESHRINLDIRMIGLESLEVFRRNDEVHGDELLGRALGEPFVDTHRVGEASAGRTHWVW